MSSRPVASRYGSDVLGWHRALDQDGIPCGVSTAASQESGLRGDAIRVTGTLSGKATDTWSLSVRQVRCHASRDHARHYRYPWFGVCLHVSRVAKCMITASWV
jgi:hypothetical protein